MLEPLNDETLGISPLNGFGTVPVSRLMVAVSRVNCLLRYCAGTGFRFVEIGWCRVWLPMYATSSTNCPGSCRCTLSSQRMLYGLIAFGSKNVMPVPRNVPVPFDEPEGPRIPLGNGLSSVESTGGSSGEGSGIVVCWLK